MYHLARIKPLLITVCVQNFLYYFLIELKNNNKKAKKKKEDPVLKFFTDSMKEAIDQAKILQEKIFDKIWIQPAAGDAGGSLGAALALWHIENGNKRIVNIIFVWRLFQNRRFFI